MSTLTVMLVSSVERITAGTSETVLNHLQTAALKQVHYIDKRSIDKVVWYVDLNNKVILLRLVHAIYILVNGQWGQWTAWTACDKASCGHQSRERQCDSPAPGIKGDPCVGEANETQWCNTDPCEGI